MTERSSGLTLRLARTLAPPPDRVFSACVESPELAAWWGPAGFTAPGIELDVRVGGKYRIAMQPPEGELFHLRGEFLEIERPRRLSYTFEWEEPDPDDQQTLVTLTFREARRGTELLLEQGPFATQARHDLHHAGWTDSFVRLDQHLATG
ncbi:MAG TPA: SRPBCC domain-containing protein [Gaiellaceae bacterium]